MTDVSVIAAIAGCLFLVLLGEILFDALFESILGRHAKTVRIAVYWLVEFLLVVLTLVLVADGGDDAAFAWFTGSCALFMLAIAAVSYRTTRLAAPRAHDPNRTRPDTD